MPEKTSSLDNAVKRYAPPPQRNRMLNRRKSGGFLGELSGNTNTIEGNHNGQIIDTSSGRNEKQFEKIHSFGSSTDKSRSSYSRNVHSADNVDVANDHAQSQSSHPSLIPIYGCCCSEAAQLLYERFAAAMHSYNDNSIALSERATLYLGAGETAWTGHLKFPHQMITKQIDFLTELRRAISSGAHSHSEDP